MKKNVIAILLIAILAAALVGCSGAATPEPSVDYTAEEILDAIKNAYGESYLPDTEITNDLLVDTYGINMDNVLEIKAEMPMIGFHPDRVIVIKANEGKGADVETNLNNALDDIRNEAAFYPSNMAKANAAKVVRNGDYVAMIMLGASDNVSETEEATATFAQTEVQKGVDAFNALFSK